MEVYSIRPSGTEKPEHAFQGNRDILPITNQPSKGASQFSGAGPDQPIDTSSHHHAIQYLKSIDKLFIQQNISLLEAVAGIEAINKYQVHDPMGQKVFLALEESGCCVRIMCGPLRNFEMHLFDNLNNEVIRMCRHLGCQCCPFWLQKLEVFCPTDVLVGYVEQEFTLLHPRLGIFDKDGIKVLQIHGPICQFKCFKDVDYHIKSLTGEVIGRISKQWMGFLQEGFTNADSFLLEFPLDLDVSVKMVLLGAAFLIDYMYYEQKKTGKFNWSL